MAIRNADSVVLDDLTNELVFVEPYETEEPFVNVLDYIQHDTKALQQNAGNLGNVKYAQTRTSGWCQRLKCWR